MGEVFKVFLSIYILYGSTSPAPSQHDTINLNVYMDEGIAVPFNVNKDEEKSVPVNGGKERKGEKRREADYVATIAARERKADGGASSGPSWPSHRIGAPSWSPHPPRESGPSWGPSWRSYTTKAPSWSPHPPRGIDGGWTDWGQCSQTCKGGIKRRHCSNPVPANGGAYCKENNMAECNEDIPCGSVDWVMRDGELYFEPQAPDEERQAFIEELEREIPGSKLVEGDMLLTRDQLKRRSGLTNKQPKWSHKQTQVYPNLDYPKYGVESGWDYQFADTNLIWPNKELLYFWDENINATQKKVVQDGIDRLSADLSGCIRFTETNRSDNRHKVYILRNTQSCSSRVGYKGEDSAFKALRMQTLALSDTRCGKWQAIHELMHALGLYHQIVRNDRDTYVTVLQEHINTTLFEDNFGLVDDEDQYDLPYDYKSLLHYGPRAFPKETSENKTTIITKNPKMMDVIGKQKRGASPQDIRQLKLLYGCEQVNIGCVRGNGEDYNGQRAKTSSNILCQKWNEDWPHNHPYNGTGGSEDHNYCRNPSGSESIWCYTIRENTRWDWCGVGPCDG